MIEVYAAGVVVAFFGLGLAAYLAGAIAVQRAWERDRRDSLMRAAIARWLASPTGADYLRAQRILGDFITGLMAPFGEMAQALAKWAKATFPAESE